VPWSIGYFGSKIEEMVGTVFISIVLIVLYGLYMIKVGKGWDKISKYSNPSFTWNSSASIIIPFRNEEKHLKNQLKQLASQIKRFSNVKLIYVNDHSTDEGAEILKKELPHYPFLTLLDQREGAAGKKQAIELGVLESDSEWIITTDADCVYHENWLATMLEATSMKNASMLIGPVSLDRNSSLFSKVQSIEYSGLMLIGAGSLALGKPNMCSGANLMFKRESFLLVEGYEGNIEIPSGDDEFLMHKIYERGEDQVGFVKSGSALVTAESCREVSEFLNQRTRWASKSKHYTKSRTRFEQLLMGVVIVWMWYLFLLTIVFANWQNAGMLLSLILMKTLFDFILLQKGKEIFGINSFMHLLAAEFFQIIYVPIVVIKHYFGIYKWKDRKFLGS
jgi:biofilm PGA synthesis N-glycosyltransferase PgaC